MWGYFWLLSCTVDHCKTEHKSQFKLGVYSCAHKIPACSSLALAAVCPAVTPLEVALVTIPSSTEIQILATRGHEYLHTSHAAPTRTATACQVSFGICSLKDACTYIVYLQSSWAQMNSLNQRRSHETRDSSSMSYNSLKNSSHRSTVALTAAPCVPFLPMLFSLPGTLFFFNPLKPAPINWCQNMNLKDLKYRTQTQHVPTLKQVILCNTINPLLSEFSTQPASGW